MIFVLVLSFLINPQLIHAEPSNYLKPLSRGEVVNWAFDTRPLTADEVSALVESRQTSDIRSAIERDSSYLSALDEAGNILQKTTFVNDSPFLKAHYIRPMYVHDRIMRSVLPFVLGSIFVYYPGIESSLHPWQPAILSAWAATLIAHRTQQLRRMFRIRRETQRSLHLTDIRKAKIVINATAPTDDSQDFLSTSLALFDFWLGRKSRVIHTYDSRDYVSTVESGMLPAFRDRIARQRLPMPKIPSPPFNFAAEISEELDLPEFTMGFLIRALQQTDNNKSESELIRVLSENISFWIQQLKILEMKLANSADEVALDFATTTLLAPENNYHLEDGDVDTIDALMPAEFERLEGEQRLASVEDLLRRTQNFRLRLQVKFKIPLNEAELGAPLMADPLSDNLFHRLGIYRLRPTRSGDLSKAYFEVRSRLRNQGADSDPVRGNELDRVEEAFEYLSEPANQIFVLRMLKNKRLERERAERLRSISVKSGPPTTGSFEITRNRYLKNAFGFGIASAAAASTIFVFKMAGFTLVDALGATALGGSVAVLQSLLNVDHVLRKRKVLETSDLERSRTEGIVYGGAIAGCIGLLHHLSMAHQALGH